MKTSIPSITINNRLAFLQKEHAEIMSLLNNPSIMETIEILDSPDVSHGVNLQGHYRLEEFLLRAQIEALESILNN